LEGIAKRIRVLDLAKHWAQCPYKGDISDWIEAGGTGGKLKALVDALPEWKSSRATAGAERNWPEPLPLPEGLLPVDPFESEFMPAALAPWVDDIASRLQCPPDFVGVAAMTALGAVIGRRIGISPQTKTDWVEIPNVWGAFIGRPGMLGEQAEAMGWTSRDLFGLHPPPDNPAPSYRRLSRYDHTGLIWLLAGRPVVALTEATAAIQNPTGNVTVYRRFNKPALGPVGDSLDYFK
jgi:Protein of unknown function (DUF3987)